MFSHWTTEFDSEIERMQSNLPRYSYYLLFNFLSEIKNQLTMDFQPNLNVIQPLKVLVIILIYEINFFFLGKYFDTIWVSTIVRKNEDQKKKLRCLKEIGTLLSLKPNPWSTITSADLQPPPNQVKKTNSETATMTTSDR